MDVIKEQAYPLYRSLPGIPRSVCPRQCPILGRAGPQERHRYGGLRPLNPGPLRFPRPVFRVKGNRFSILLPFCITLTLIECIPLWLRALSLRSR